MGCKECSPGAQEKAAGPDKGVTVTVSQDKGGPLEAKQGREGVTQGLDFSDLTSIRCDIERAVCKCQAGTSSLHSSDPYFWWSGGLLIGHLLYLEASAFSRTMARLLEHLFALASSTNLLPRGFSIKRQKAPYIPPVLASWCSWESGRMDLMTSGG